MSFGSGGFGSNNNNSTFGGFGSSNAGGGFGANNNTSSGGSLFGGNTATSGGFGGGGGFGASNTQNNPFGTSKPAFGASTTTTSGGGLFGGNTSTSGGFGGGFGSTTNNTASGFGSNNNSGGGGKEISNGVDDPAGTDNKTGLFGQNKPATTGFGASNTGGSLFGGGSNTGGFGASNTTSGFGANNNTTNTSGFGANNNTGGAFSFGGAASNANTNGNQGTLNTPFNPFQEKEGATNATSLYQSITFQAPYQSKSFEELRLEDYSQGRKFGNSNGQAGAFGQSTGFGGFASSNNTNTNTNTTGGGLFGNTNNTSNTGSTGFGGFGSSNTTNNNTGGFGSTNTNTGGGLFGAQQNKPAGSLFGNTNQTSGTTTGSFGSTSGSGGGLFGNSSGGFGANTNNQQGGGLFGSNNNNQQQSKPAFGGFGSTTNNQSSTSFGTNNQSGGGLFGNTNNQQSGGGLFGANNNNNNNNNNQQQQSAGFGSSTNTGGGLFGSTNKPAGGLFGNTNNTTSNNGSSLFGNANNQQQQSGGGLFGSSTNNNNTGGGLFGNQNQNKPAGTGLFGSSTNTGGGLFGNNNNNNQQQQQNTGFGSSAGGSLFGNQSKPAGTSLFGNTNNNASNTGGGLSLFGNNTNTQQNNAGSSLFGNSIQNQNQQNNSGSLFGGSFGQSNQQQPQQNQLHASLTGAPYGNEQLFASLAAPSPPVGPLATPLSGARPAPRKTPSLLASARLTTPNQFSPRGSTVAARGGYGFNYSTYGTPGSAFTAGSLTPGASSLLRPTGSLSSGLTSRLGKSSSMSNLRGESPANGRSLLRPGVFSPPSGNSSFGSRNVRKLNIDRNIRTDLFPPAQEEKAIEAANKGDGAGKKQVNFESPREETATPPAGPSNALVRTEDSEDNEPSKLLRSGKKVPEMEQVNGAHGALSTVPEDSEPSRPSSAPSTQQPAEKSRRTEIGEYWTKPPMKDLKKFTRQQLKNVGNFVVGRDGVGSIEFGSVDLTNTPIEDICGNIVQLTPRSATVYQDDANKPAMGKALNVPSTIHLEHSWPRSHGGRKPVSAKSGPEYEKHIRRLKRVGGTKFQDYNPNTGVWTFTVEHFTTYGLDDDDDTESESLFESQMQQDSSGLSDAPETPTGQQEVQMEDGETPTGEMDDTFQFKLDRRSQMSVPGGFGSEGVSDDYDDANADEAMEDDRHQMSGGLGQREMDDPFTSSGGPVQAPSPGAIDRYQSSMVEDAEEEDEVEDLSQEIPGAFADEPKMPKSILRPTAGLSAFASPEKLATETWEEQLQKTLSPKKRDRQALRDMQQSYFRAQEEDVMESPFKQSMLGQSQLGQSYLVQKSAKKAHVQPTLLSKSQLGQSKAFTSAKDIMDSLWAQEKPGRKAAAAAKGFELPYPKRRRLSSSDDLRPNDLEWHDTLKPHFTDARGTMVYAVPGAAPALEAPFEQTMKPLVGAHKDVRFAKFKPVGAAHTEILLAQKERTKVEVEDGFPAAKVPKVFFYSMSDSADLTTPAGRRERWVWKICSIFLDLLPAAVGEIAEGVPDIQRPPLDEQMRTDALGAFWAKEILGDDVQASLRKTKSAEEKALVLLTKNDITGACDVLAEARNFKLAMMVSQLPSSEHSRNVMRAQIQAWKQRNDWSEMSDAVRAMYSILAGNVCNVDGKTGAAENRVEGFNISEHFGFSWRQGFALRLFFGGFHHADEAIRAYGRDLTDGLEPVIPSMRWEDGTETADALIEVLMLLAGSADLSRVFDPVVMTGSAFDTRLTWQLASIFNASGKCPVPDEQLDQITLNYAIEVEAAGNLSTAAWVLLHLHDHAARERAVRALLERNAEEVTEGTAQQDADAMLELLTEQLLIPTQLIHRVRAFYAASHKDAASQTLSLILAGDIEDAHAVICTTVGPQAVIEQDYDELATLLRHFDTTSTQGRPEKWAKGGQVYLDFLRLVKGPGRGERGMEKLKRGLRGMEGVEGEGKQRSLEERVARREMRRVVEEAEKEVQGGDREVQMGGGGLEGGTAGGNDGARMLDAYRRAMGVVA